METHPIKPEKAPQQVQCLGALFHSQARIDANKRPLCAGYQSRLEESISSLPKESVPAGQFKYMCVGYSIYDKERQKEGRQRLDETVELPYCEGLEVISASELLKTPATLNEAAGGASMSGRDAMPQDARVPAAAQQRQGRSFVPGGGEGGRDWDAFSERFMKTSRKIVDRMGSNMAFMGRSAKHALDRWSRWGDED